MRRKIGRNSGADSGLPATLVKTWTPRAPSSFTARSISASAASMLFIGSDATKAGKRSGCLPHSSARASFAMRASSGVVPGGAMSSSGGLASESTCCSPSNSSSSASRASTSQRVLSLGKAVSTTWPGTRSPRRSKYAFGMKWLKMSIIMTWLLAGREPRLPYCAIALAAKSSSSFINLGVNPCSSEYCAMVSSTWRLAAIPWSTMGV